jgi:hypothetical protein
MTERPFVWFQRHPWANRAFLAQSAISVDSTGPMRKLGSFVRADSVPIRTCASAACR